MFELALYLIGGMFLMYLLVGIAITLLAAAANFGVFGFVLLIVVAVCVFCNGKKW